MKVTRMDGMQEKMILAAMITNSTVLGMIASKWTKGGLFESDWSNLIGQWCVQHYQAYQKAPRKGIQALYEKWSEDNRDEEKARLIRYFLESLPDIPQSNSDHLLDMAGKLFNKIKLLRLAEKIQESLDVNDLTLAEETITKYHRLEIGEGAGIDLVQDTESIVATFDQERKEALIKYPDPMDKFFLNALERDSFIAFQAQEKIGKSNMLIDMAFRAMRQRRRVAFFSVGDMSENQIKERFLVRIAKHPIRSPNGTWPARIKIPDGFTRVSQDKKDVVQWKPTYRLRSYDKPLDASIALKACESFMTEKVRSKEPFLKISCHSNDSISIMGIKSIIDSWILKGWVPDVIVIDYADILAPIAAGEPRDQNNATWKKMRAMSQDYHCLLVTATQSNAISYKETLQSRRHFSEDKRKLAHATAVIGINITDEEKNMNMMRLNYVVKREGAYSSTRVIYIAGCLSIMNPCVVAKYSND